MTLLLGLWGFLYATVIPGLLAVRLFRFDRVFAGLPLAFALSLVINHATVCLLTLAGLYTRPVMLTVAASASIWLLAVDHWPDTGFARVLALVPRVPRWLSAAFAERQKPRVAPLISAIITVIALVEFVQFAAAAFQNFADVFTVWDSVVSWNHWARSWAAGVVPDFTYYYPQLLPTTWSVPYVLMGRTDLQFFSASIDRFYLVFMIWVLFEHSLLRRRIWLLAAVPAVIVLLTEWNGTDLISESLADIPVAFFALLTVATIVATRRLLDRKDIARSLWLVAALAFGAASTKQAGIIIAVATPVLLWFYGLCHSSLREDRRPIERAFVLSNITMLVLSSAWYVRCHLMILAGRNLSEVNYVTSGIYEGRSIPERIITATTMLAHVPGSTAIVLILVLAAMSLRARSWRIPMFGIAASFVAVWAAFFSYDGRNATLALPLIALLAGEGLVAWRLPLLRLSRELAFRLSERFPSPPAGYRTRRLLAGMHAQWIFRALVLLACILFGLIAAYVFPDERLAARQRYFEETRLGIPAINTLIQTAVARTASRPVSIVSEYRWACAIDRVRQNNPCRRIFSAQEAAEGIAKNPGAMILVVSPGTAQSLAQPLLEQRFTRVGAASDYEVWEKQG